jgi:hypothetical protein
MMHPKGEGLSLVRVLRTADTFTLRLAKASLDAAGIPYLEKGEDRHLLPGFHGSSGIGEVPIANASTWIFVRPKDEEAATSLVGHLNVPLTGEDE